MSTAQSIARHARSDRWLTSLAEWLHAEAHATAARILDPGLSDEAGAALSDELDELLGSLRLVESMLLNRAA